MGERLVVGVLGLGAMGGPIAGLLAEAGHEVHVHDLDPAAVEAAKARGARPADGPRALGRACDAVLVIVPTDEDVVAACTGPSGVLAGARPETVVLLCSSLRIETCEAIAAAAPPGVDVLDAALTGGVRGAVRGKINLLVGGPEAALERVRPALMPWTIAVHHLGALGAGQIGKTANNLIHWSQIAVIAEAFAFARAYGVSGPRLRAALQTSSTDSRTLREIEEMRFTWHAKDLANAFSMAAPKDVRLPMSEAAREAMLGITVAGVSRLLTEEAVRQQSNGSPAAADPAGHRPPGPSSEATERGAPPRTC